MNTDIHVFNTQVRRDIITMIGEAKSGHPGGSLSVVEILSTLYNRVMKADSANPQDPERDFLVLSKGHAAPALYAVLANAGYFDREILPTLRKLGSPLQGHPDGKKCPGVEVSTGSLGQGISIALGIAIGNKLNSLPNKTFAIVGDGEMQEGQFWEACMAAAHYELENFTVVIDKNNLQIDGATDDVMSLGDVPAKMAAFGFAVEEVDGHDVEQLEKAFKSKTEGKPKCVVANTIKGKGVDFMEDQSGWHGKAPSADEVNSALEQLK